MKKIPGYFQVFQVIQVIFFIPGYFQVFQVFQSPMNHEKAPRVSPGVAGNGGDITIENIVPIVLKQ